MAGVVARLHDYVDREGRSVDGFKIHAGALDAKTVEDFARLEEIGITECIVMPWMDAGNDALGVPLGRRLELIHRFGEEIITPLNATAARH